MTDQQVDGGNLGIRLAIWGPSSVLCWRRLASMLDQRPGGFTLEVADLAHALGLGAGIAQHSPMSRTLRRLAMFGMARFTDATTYAVRRRIPPASASQLRRMRPQLAAIHSGLLAHHDAQRLAAGEPRANCS